VDPITRRQASVALASLSALRGRVGEAEAYLDQAADHARRVGASALALTALLSNVDYEHLLRGDTAAALRRMTAVLRQEPPGRMRPADRPYASLIMTAAWMGDAGRARALLAEAAALPDSVFQFATADSLGIEGMIALAEGRPRDAIRSLSRVPGLPFCTGTCGLFILATAYDRAGIADTAVAIYERYLAVTVFDRIWEDGAVLPVVLRRLGAVLEARGEGRRAAGYYRRLADLWAGADRQLQPIARDARQRAQRLQAQDD
jgi:tetratricopeptide (TPR) repeat protein